MRSEALQDRFNQTPSMELVLTPFIFYATTMESYFLIILIFLQSGIESEAAQLQRLSAVLFPSSLFILFIVFYLFYL